jgi:hypothetical protein
MYIQIVSMIARSLKGSFNRLIRFFEQDTQRSDAIIVHYSAYRWCDSTERALNNALIGSGNWLRRSQ